MAIPMNRPAALLPVALLALAFGVAPAASATPAIPPNPWGGYAFAQGIPTPFPVNGFPGVGVANPTLEINWEATGTLPVENPKVVAGSLCDHAWNACINLAGKAFYVQPTEALNVYWWQLFAGSGCVISGHMAFPTPGEPVGVSGVSESVHVEITFKLGCITQYHSNGHTRGIASRPAPPNWPICAQSECPSPEWDGR